MKNITYLFGAGASCNALPLLNEMNIRMEYFRNFIVENKHYFKSVNTDNFVSTLNEIIEKMFDRNTIDVYARELYIQNTPDSILKLDRLKFVLTSFFLFEQAEKHKDFNIASNVYNEEVISGEYDKIDSSHLNQIRTVIDKRYRTFWGEFLNNQEKQLPPNINILSWNYDLQLELSYSDLLAIDVSKSSQVLQVFPSKLKELDFSKSKIIKLNGTAGQFYFNGNDGIDFMFNKENVHESLKSLITFFNIYQNNSTTYPIFSFAWENIDSIITARKFACKILSNTDVLVIIGYSLPTYNRLIDQEIFKEATRISKVYFQVPDFAVNVIKPTLSSLRRDFHKITDFVTDTSKFYVPNEYYE